MGGPFREIWRCEKGSRGGGGGRVVGAGRQEWEARSPGAARRRGGGGREGVVAADGDGMGETSCVPVPLSTVETAS